MSAAVSCDPPRELAHRVSGGLEITLYWCPADDVTSIEIWQPASGERIAFNVRRDQALAAFHHPFAHIALSSERSPAAQESGALS